MIIGVLTSKRHYKQSTASAMGSPLLVTVELRPGEGRGGFLCKNYRDGPRTQESCFVGGVQIHCHPLRGTKSVE